MEKAERVINEQNRLCKNCMYFDLESERWGLCRKRPPVIVPGDEETVRETVWPYVRGEYDWCGELKIKASK